VAAGSADSSRLVLQVQRSRVPSRSGLRHRSLPVMAPPWKETVAPASAVPVASSRPSSGQNTMEPGSKLGRISVAISVTVLVLSAHSAGVRATLSSKASPTLS
jgi:hypothetical protein